MNVKELIVELQKVEDKSLEVRCIDVSGEVRLLASE